MSRSLILTHADLDGMVSGILLLTKLGQDACIRITNGSRLAESIRLRSEDVVPIDSAYISDIPLDRVRVDEVYDALETLTGQGVSLHLYDHHKGWNETANHRFRQLFATYDVDESKTTAAVLIWRDFLNRDLSCQRWLELLGKKDSSTDGSVADDFRLLAALTQPEYARRRSEIMLDLASGTSIGDRCEIVSWYLAQHLPRERDLAAHADVFETLKGRRIGWLDLRDEPGLYANIGKLVIGHHSVDLVAKVIRNGVTLGGAAIDRGIDLSFLHGCHNVSGIGIEVVGHRSPVRLRPLDGVVSDEFVLAAKSLICERV